MQGMLMKANPKYADPDMGDDISTYILCKGAASKLQVSIIVRPPKEGPFFMHSAVLQVIQGML